MAVHLDTPSKHDSSSASLSSAPSGLLSDAASPPRAKRSKPKPKTLPSTAAAAADDNMDEIVVSNERRPQQTTFTQYQPPGKEQPPPPPPPPNDAPTTTASGRQPAQKRYELIDGKWVQLTAAGVPRKKPGRKPGTVMKPKTDNGEQPKTRKPRKPRDPDAAPVQRKRKATADAEPEAEPDATRTPTTAAARPAVASPNSTSHSFHQSPQTQYSSPKMPKREGYPSSMQSILNDDPPPQPSSMPVRTSGQSYDPIRGNYGPSRDASQPHNPYSPASGSPRGPAQASNRSPSIASLLEPGTAPQMSPSNSHSSHHQSRLQVQDNRSMPPSPSHPPKPFSVQKPEAPPARPIPNPSNFTTIANGPIRKVSPKQKPYTGMSTPKTDNLDDFGGEGEGRSILDFGKAKPGEEAVVPTIVLSIPISTGETNKYVNFLRLAEDRYGWDALHPRLAANRDRKARIAAAAANLEKIESGRESGDEMSVDLSDGEGSNPENGASGTDNQPKPKKKRNFKEDQYDVEDDFVDDSELLWEAQAAASRDGFFVYSGPLVPEVEKPAAGYVAIVLLPEDGLILLTFANSHEERPRRGRGRGSRGGRGGTTRGGATGRGGGPGSRGGIVRKPRITKAERLLREKEKAEREKMAQVDQTPTNGYVLQPTSTAAPSYQLGA